MAPKGSLNYFNVSRFFAVYTLLTILKVPDNRTRISRVGHNIQQIKTMVEGSALNLSLKTK